MKCTQAQTLINELLASFPMLEHEETMVMTSDTRDVFLCTHCMATRQEIKAPDRPKEAYKNV